MKRVILLIAAVVALGSGCFTVNAAVPGTLRSDVQTSETESVGTVAIEKTHFFFFWGLVGAPEKSFISDDLTKQVSARGGDGVANLRYEAQTGCLSLLISSVTCGIVAPRDYKVTGEVVKIKVPTLAGGTNQPLQAPPSAANPTPGTPDTPPPSYAY